MTESVVQRIIFVEETEKDTAVMNKTRDRKNIVSQIEQAADMYRKHLVGKRFMYVFDNRYIEVIYKSENYIGRDYDQHAKLQIRYD